MSTIVVGVDGSEESVEALRFALDEAARSHAAVKAVTAWHVPPAAYGMGWTVPVEPESYETVARKLLRPAERAAVQRGKIVQVRVDPDAPKNVRIDLNQSMAGPQQLSA